MSKFSCHNVLIIFDRKKIYTFQHNIKFLIHYQNFFKSYITGNFDLRIFSVYGLDPRTHRETTNAEISKRGKYTSNEQEYGVTVTIFSNLVLIV